MQIDAMIDWTKYKAALFDLDGVIFHTEPQYDRFWEGICGDYCPDDTEMIRQMKGQTLTYILNRWFSGERAHLQTEIVRRLNDFEAQMLFDYVPGFEEYLADLHRRGIRTAVVTSSNAPKLAQVCRCHPQFRAMFDAVVSAEDFQASKPAPDSYLEGARRVHVAPQACVAYEDSINGLKAARAAGMYVVALATTLPAAELKPLSDRQVADFTALL